MILRKLSDNMVNPIYNVNRKFSKRSM